MPIDPSFMKNEPSMGPVPSQTTVKGSTLTAAEIAANVEQKTIANDPLVLQLVATTPNSSIFVCDDTYQVAGCTAVADTLGGASAAVTVERLTGVQAPGSGVAQLSATLPIGSTGTIHAVQTGTVKANPDTFQVGDRVGIVLSGTLTALVGMVAVTLKRV